MWIPCLTRLPCQTWRRMQGPWTPWASRIFSRRCRFTNFPLSGADFPCFRHHRAGKFCRACGNTHKRVSCRKRRVLRTRRFRDIFLLSRPRWLSAPSYIHRIGGGQCVGVAATTRGTALRTPSSSIPRRSSRRSSTRWRHTS